MAEVLGIAASAIAVGGLAGKLTISVLALKRLWNEVRDVPETIENLVKNLELVNPVLSEMEMEFLRLSGTVLNDSAAKLSIKYCRQAVHDLEVLVEDIRGQVTSTRRLKRNIAKLKVSIKKESISNYQHRLQYALQILSLSHQTYIMALVRQSDWHIAEQHTAIHKQNCTVPYLHKQKYRPIAEPCANLLCTGDNLLSEALPWRSAFVIGNFSSLMFEQVKAASSGPPVYHARVQLPTWFAQKVWDFLVCKASNGWKFTHLWNIRPYQSVVFDYAYHGSLRDILSVVKSGQASLHDRDPDGRTILHYAAFKGHLETFKCLMHMGLRASERDTKGFTPLAYLYRSTEDTSSAVDFVRFLVGNGGLEDAIYAIFSPGYRSLRETSLHRLIWAVPGLLPVVVGELQANFLEMPPSHKFASLIWEYVDPELLLSVLRHDKITPVAAFRAHLHDHVESSLHQFAKIYFSRSPPIRRDSPKLEDNPDRERKFDHWRTLARWIFSGISKQEMSKQGGALWESSTPLITGLTGCDWTVPKSARERRFVLRRLSRTTKMWLEDVKLSGLDLSGYGRRELKLYTFDNWNHTWRWNILGLDEEASYPSGPQLVSFTYGPRPEDWNFIWDLAVEEYVGNFWKMIDNPPMHIPGQWVND